MNFLSVRALYTEHHAYFAAQLRTGTCNRLYLYSSRSASQIPIILDIMEVQGTAGRFPLFAHTYKAADS